tara:strand:+ start:2668 stop:2970 length:303 start_codon:yes stop_codon:yes gene_type:complete
MGPGCIVENVVSLVNSATLEVAHTKQACNSAFERRDKVALTSKNVILANLNINKKHSGRRCGGHPIVATTTIAPTAKDRRSEKIATGIDVQRENGSGKTG